MGDPEGEPPLTPFTPLQQRDPDSVSVTSSKRLRSDSGSSSRTIEQVVLPEDDDGGPFQEVVSSRSKRSRRGSSSHQSINVVVPASRTVLFTPSTSGGNVRKINKHVLSDELDSIAMGQVVEARVNVRKNVIAVDAKAVSAVHALLATTTICGVPVRAFLPRPPNTRAGVIRDVATTISDGKLLSLCFSGVKVVEARRFGNTTTVQLLFEGDTIPSHVKLGLVRYPVHPYTPRPLQCHQCHRIGHVAGSCLNVACCPKCTGEHAEKDCTATILKCVNCKKPHGANSPTCPQLQRERKICMIKEGGKMTFSDAIKQVHNVPDKDFPALEARSARPLSQEPLGHPLAVTKVSPPVGTPLPTPAVTSTAPASPKQKIAGDTVSKRPFSFAQTMQTIVRGLRLLFCHLSYDWAVCIVRVLDFVEPLLGSLC